MQTELYISAASCISPVSSLNNRSDITMPVTSGQEFVKCIEPDYKEYIPVKDLRRMNRLQKMGVATALDCLNKMDNPKLDAIIEATGWGCIDSTYQFLDRMFNLQNLPVNPSAFILSTHNAVTAQIAMRLKCHTYNNTVTDDELPFELALDDAISVFQDNRISNVLLGCADEITPQLIAVLKKIASPRQIPVIGEGSAFFLLSTNKTKEEDIQLKYFKISSISKTRDTLADTIKTYGVDGIYTNNKNNFAGRQYAASTSIYTELCGNYPTSTGFGLWYVIQQLNLNNSKESSLMLYNEAKNGLGSVIVVSK